MAYFPVHLRLLLFDILIVSILTKGDDGKKEFLEFGAFLILLYQEEIHLEAKLLLYAFRFQMPFGLSYLKIANLRTCSDPGKKNGRILSVGVT